jgi:Putative DNA-binding domain
MFAAIQDEFAAALLDAEKPVPRAVTSHTFRTPAKRFGVYRNNVVGGLVNALRMRFPVVEKIVGKEFFAAMARVFATAHPPQSPLLMLYGDAFADFIATFEPTSALPYLPDIARLEIARTRAYHAADAEPIDPARLRGFDAGELRHIRVTLHPSLQILPSRHPIVTIWAMNSGEAALRPIDVQGPEDALVMRPRLEVTVRRLPPGGAAFLKTLSAGAALGDAAERAGADHSQFDLTANLARLIGSGAMVDFFTYGSKKDRVG